MLLIIALLFLILFAGAGFAAHVLWWGLLLGLILIVAHVVSGSGPGRW